MHYEIALVATVKRWLHLVPRRLGAFGMTAGLLLISAGPLLEQCNPPAQTPQDRVVQLVNERRGEAGLAPVSVSGQLTTAAQNHSADQARTGVMSHTGSDGSNTGTRISRTGYRYRTYGENVAAGYGSADAVMTAWMNSSGHRANILNGNFTQIGVGLAYKSDGTPFWTMVLAAPA